MIGIFQNVVKEIWENFDAKCLMYLHKIWLNSEKFAFTAIYVLSRKCSLTESALNHYPPSSTVLGMSATVGSQTVRGNRRGMRNSDHKMNENQ